MSGPPIMRRPTRWERIVWRCTGYWPDSYVGARLRWLAAHDRYFRARMEAVGPLEAMREMRGAP